MYSVNRELVERLSIAPDAFTGQTALVTGGARGIGEATATTLAALGARVVVIDRLPAGEDVAAAIRAAGGDAVFKACDISDVDQLNDVIAGIGETVGTVDILINNALHVHAAPVVALELEDWEKTFATNARAHSC
jgi:NAD(P)-dependent dehydrogenase (short-subunit alcohol dehydrogenase family)